MQQQIALKLFATFNSQVALLMELSAAESLDARLEAITEVSLHRRDAHQGHYDVEMYARSKRGREDKLSVLREKIKWNAEEINRLMNEALRTPETQ